MSVQQSQGVSITERSDDRYRELRGIPLVVVEGASSQAGLASFRGRVHPIIKRT